MPESKPPIQGSETAGDALDLDAQIDALLSRIDETIKSFDEAAGQAPSPEPQDEVPRDGLMTDEGFAESPAEAPAALASDEPDAEAVAAAAVSLSAGIDALLDGLDDAAFASVPVEGPREPAAPALSGRAQAAASAPLDAETADRAVPSAIARDPDADLAVDELDHELASLISDEMRAEAVTRREDPAAAVRVPESADPPIEAEPAVGSASAAAGPVAAPVAATTGGARRGPRLVLPPGRPPVPQDAEWRDWLGFAWACARWLTPIGWRIARSAAMRAGRWAAPYLARGVELSAKPLESRPAIVRSAVGWVAAYTAFLALCVWGFVLLFRQPDKPAATKEPVRLSETTATSTAS